MKKIITLIIIALVILFVCSFTVDNTETAIISRMGKPVRVITEPGLHPKIPFIEQTITLTKRTMQYTTQPSTVITKDKKSIMIDYYCQWRVSDPLQFYLKVKDNNGAAKAIDDLIYAGLKQELAKHDLIEIINESRRKIMQNVTVITREKAFLNGIEIIDIRIKKADLPQENEKNIFARMITERERIAKQYRSEGLEEAQKIRAKTDMDVQVMLAEAEKEAQRLRGAADAEAIRIYAKAFSVDPDFYEFNKLMSFYSETDARMKIIITTDSKMFRVIKRDK